ncbi:MAG: acyltransferase family protein [Enterobacteriaceae bacterium]|nr:acyltransferase family protein [Enterobacteriaceae bacterium]
MLAYLCFLVPVNKEYISQWGAGIGRVDLNFLYSIYSGAISPYINGISTYNWVLWSMKIELLGSIFIYLVAMFSRNLPKNTPIYIAIIAFFIFIDQNEKDYLGYSAFFIGMFIYTKNITIKKKSSIIMFLLGLYFSGVHTNSYSYSFMIDLIPFVTYGNIYGMFNFIGGVLIVFSILVGNLFSNFLSLKILELIGKCSFSIYLIHLSIFYIIGYPLFHFLYNYLGYFLNSFLTCLSIVFITIFFSYFFEKYIDSNAVLLSNKLSKFLVSRKTTNSRVV